MHSSFLSGRWRSSTLGMGKASPQCQTISNRQVNDGNLKRKYLCVPSPKKSGRAPSPHHCNMQWLAASTTVRGKEKTHTGRGSYRPPCKPHPIHSVPFPSLLRPLIFMWERERDFWAQPAKIHPFTTSTGILQDLTACKLVAIHLDRPISYILLQVPANFFFIVMTTGQELGHW